MFFCAESLSISEKSKINDNSQDTNCIIFCFKTVLL